MSVITHCFFTEYRWNIIPLLLGIHTWYADIVDLHVLKTQQKTHKQIISEYKRTHAHVLLSYLKPKLLHSIHQAIPSIFYCLSAVRSLRQQVQEGNPQQYFQLLLGYPKAFPGKREQLTKDWSYVTLFRISGTKPNRHKITTKTHFLPIVSLQLHTLRKFYIILCHFVVFAFMKESPDSLLCWTTQ